jgi:enoyl-CoA hydratase
MSEIEGGAAAPDILIERRRAAGVVTLNRPTAQNAVNAAMRAPLAALYPRLARDPEVYCAVIKAAGGRAFSAGGDVRETLALYRDDPAKGRAAFAEEYGLAWLHECYSKPTVSLIDGAVMGTGVGITLYGTHRVAGEHYRFAMPETAIGLFPDVGVAHAFARMPDSVGVYLGLTGRAIGRADAYALGLVTHCIAAAEFPAIEAALADADPVDPVLDDRHVAPGEGELPPLAGVIGRCFSAPTVEDIRARLEAVSGTHGDFAQRTLDDLAKRSPLALKITLRHIRAAAGLDLRQTLVADYRIACRCLAGPDFAEGVRAALVDKDQAPRWQPATLAEVSGSMVDEYFASLGADELNLLSRPEMQASRV